MPTYIFDDTNGDQRPGSDSPALVYAGVWNQTDGSCLGCRLDSNAIPIDETKAEMKTLHGVTVAPESAATSVSVTFTGGLEKLPCNALYS